MTAVATFHAAAQASGLKYLIAPSAAVVLTGDSLTGIGSSEWSVIGTANSAIVDWVLSASSLHTVTLTAPAGSDKACIVQRIVTSGRDRLVATLKVYAGTERPCTNETNESDSVDGWGGLINTALAAAALTPYASTPAAIAAAGATGASADYARGDHVHAHGAVATATNSSLCARDGSAQCAFSTVTATTHTSDQVAMVCRPAARSTAGVGYGLTVAGGTANGSNAGGVTTIGADNGGTPGTNLAGNVEIQLGSPVANVTARQRFLANATTICDVYQPSATTFRIEAASAASTTLQIYALGGSIAFASGSNINVTSSAHVFLTGPTAINSVAPVFNFYDSGSTLRLACTVASAYVENTPSGGSRDLQYNATSRIKLDATGIGFFATAPAAKPTVTGSRGGNAALASLLTGLASLGLLTDSSSA